MKGIEVLAERGLNIFASCAVRDLPDEILDFFPRGEIAGFDDLSLILLGHGGKTLWEALPHPLDPHSHPIDHYVLEQVEWFAQSVLEDPQFIVAYPHSHWVLPLQRIGRFLDLARPSLLGLDMHPEFGLWFAYRAVILTTKELPSIRGVPFTVACETCIEKPCQTVCPAQAVQNSAAEFKLGACADYRLQNQSRCHDRCLARIACPIRAEHRYSAEQIHYHMTRPNHLQKLREYRHRK